MIRLGLRLALADGRRSAVAVALTALAVAVGTAILLFAISFEPALQERNGRDAWRQPSKTAASEESQKSGLLMLNLQDRYRGEPLTRVLVSPLSSAAPIPPGLSRNPTPGEAFVSPALASLLARLPADQLGDRIEAVVGTIGPAGLRSPQELVAVIGVDPAALASQGGLAVGHFSSHAPAPDLPPQAILILVLAVVGALVPVAVFVATATRLSAAQREQRLAALRLVGATPGQVARLAVVESLLCTGFGAPAGLLIFFAVRPLVALIPLDGATWYPETIQPPVAPAALLLLAVQLVGAAAVLLSMRRVVVSPLGVQQRVTPPPPRATRLTPLAVGVVLLLGGLWLYRGASLSEPGPLVLFGASFATVIGGIAFAGPWLTAGIGRILGRIARGPAALLAGRRLSNDPRGSFGSIAGVIMAVFVAGAFFTFSSYARVSAGGPQVSLRAGVAMATVPDGTDGPAILERLSGLEGVHSTVAIRGVVVGDGSSVLLFAWVAPCDALVAAIGIPGAACAGSPVHSLLPAETRLDATYFVTAAQAGVPGSGSSEELKLDATSVKPLLPGGSRPVALPDLIIEPTALGGGETFPITQLYVVMDGDPATAERVRTAVEAIAPTAFVALPDEPNNAIPQYTEVDRIVGLGLLGSLLLAGCSLAVAVTTGVLERRRQFALLRAAGMPLGRLRALVLLQAGVPLVAVSSFSALLGVGIAQAVTRIVGSQDVPLPDAGLLWVLGWSLLGAMTVVAATLPAVDRLTRLYTLRQE